MYAIELTSPSFEAFRETTRPDVALDRGEIRIRQRAGSVNFLDVAIASGQYPVPSFPLVPVCDGAGEVVEIGPEVTGFEIGDRVVQHAKPMWIGGPVHPATAEVMRGVSLPGALAEHAVASANSVVHVPAHLDFEEAATLPIAATTAWNAIRSARVRPGTRVLLLGTGGVSLFALQLAKAAGAHVTITSSSDEKLERARMLGADELVNYRQYPSWEKVVRERGGPVDLVVETGGSATFAKSVDIAAHGGTVFVIGFLSGADAAIDLLAVMKKALNVQGNNTGSVADLADAVRAIAASKTKPVIDARFSLAETSAAYRHLAEGKAFGKVVITHGER